MVCNDVTALLKNAMLFFLSFYRISGLLIGDDGNKVIKGLRYLFFPDRLIHLTFYVALGWNFEYLILPYPFEMCFDIENPLGVSICKQLIVRMRAKIIFSGEEGPNTLNPQDAFVVIHREQFILCHKLPAKLLIVHPIAGIVASGIAVAVAVYRLLS